LIVEKHRTLELYMCAMLTVKTARQWREFDNFTAGSDSIVIKRYWTQSADRKPH